MKTRKVILLFGSVFLLFTCNLFADGIVNFSNVGEPPEARIYTGEWVYRNGTFEFVTMTPCSGPNFHAALYWGRQGTPDVGLTQIGASTAFLPTASTAGMFSGGNRTIMTPEVGPVTSFQVRAWQGPYATYEEAFYSGPAALLGAGPVFDVDTAAPHDPLQIPTKISDAPGWRGFVFGYDNVTAILVPEPSTLLLFILGLGAALFLRTRQGMRTR